MPTSYKWPVAPQYYTFLTTTYGDKYSAVLNSYGNEYIMCDQYHGNCFGSAVDYWSKFRDYYGSWNCIMNWLHVDINNGSGGGHVACPYINEESSSWSDLLDYANNNGINKVWLYAYETGDENAIVSFCNSAWMSGWLLRLAKRYEIIWRCESPNPCVNCDWFNHKGGWYVAEQYYLDEQYFAY